MDEVISAVDTKGTPKCWLSALMPSLISANCTSVPPDAQNQAGSTLVMAASHPVCHGTGLYSRRPGIAPDRQHLAEHGVRICIRQPNLPC